MRSPFLFLLLLTGCPNPDGKDDTASVGDDTGGDTDEVVYDPGCITIDGGGGYANLADAVTVAQEGALIELCDGSYVDAVTVDKSVTIRGASVDGVHLLGSGADIPLTITGTGVTVENLVIESARTGIDIKSGAEATLSQVTIAAAGSWGVSATGATVVISGLTLIEPAAGGVQVAGGTADIDDAVIEYPGGIGVDISDDAVVSLSNTTITGTVMLSDDVTDGFAVNIDQGTLSMSGSAIVGADGMGIYASEADITVVDTTIADAVYLAIYGLDSVYDLTGLTVTGTVLQGIYATGDSFSMSSSSVVADSELSCSYLYEEWNSSYGPWCGGMFIVADATDLTDVDVSGWNNYGWLLVPNAADMTTVSVTGGTVDDVGRWGAYLVSAEGTVSGLTVSNSREPEIVDPCAGYINQSAGLLADSSELTFDGITVTGNAGWGMSQLLSTSTITNSTFSGNGCYTFVNYQASATISGTTFSNGAANGGIYDSEGVLVLDGNTFSDNSAGDYQQYDYGDYIYTYSASGGQGQDVFAYGTGALTVTNNTFSGGDGSVGAYLAGSVEVTGNTWTDYEGTVFAASYLTAPAYFANNTIEDVAGSVVQASSSEVEVENVQIGSTRASDLIEVSYSYDYEDDTQDFSGSYTTSSSSSVFYVTGYYYDDGTTVTDEPGSLSIADVSVGSAYGTLLYSSDGALDVTGLTVGTVGGNLLGGYWYGYGPDVEISGVTAGAVASTAFSVYNNTPTDFGTLSLTDVAVESAGGDAIYTTAVGGIVLTDVSFGSVSGDGLQTLSRTYDYTYEYDAATGSYIYTYVDLDAATEVSIDGLTLASVTGNGLTLQGGSADVTGLVVDAATGSGLDVEGLSALTIRDSTITAPGASGVTSTDSYSYYSYAESTYGTSEGSSAMTLTNVTVTDAGADAYAFDGGTVTMSGTSGTSAGGSGLTLTNTTADVQTNTFTGNTEYGMTCDETVTLATCAGNDLSENVLGTHLDCSDTCAE
ncbi:MAG: right-handed parallel beta-helix repeat-containing protein [Pseudomonadota bacterium]|nr:right-handed parallel beta-helix repeat-containing protein [Pseudomonadota bacterium]